MRTTSLARAVQAELAQLTNTDANDWFLVFRARYGIEAVLRALKRHHKSGEIITQPFTCATAVVPILNAGYIPEYIDTSYDTLSLDVSQLTASKQARGIIMQHSFGIPANMKRARAFATKRKLLLIEDSAHQLGMIARDSDGMPYADVSIHSFGVEKMLPTKFGGAVWVNPNMKDTALREQIVTTLKTLPHISPNTAKKVRRYRFFNRLINHTPPYAKETVRSFLINSGLFEPAISDNELNGKPHLSPARPNTFILEAILRGMKSYTVILGQRRAAADVYRKTLPKRFTIPKSTPKTDYAPVRFPILCETPEEAERLFDMLREHGHYSGKWYRPVLFPGVTDAKKFNYDKDSCPVAEDIASRILNLPTNITALEAKEIVDVLCSKSY